MLDHHRKWTNKLVDQYSTFTSTIPQLNKQQSLHYSRPAYKHEQMPQNYRTYASSLSKKSSVSRMETSANMFDYLKTLSFIKCRHREDCTSQSTLKKKRNHCKIENKSININKNCGPLVTQHIHTVQTVFVPTSPHFITQPILRVEPANRAVHSFIRPASAPKVSFNYTSPPCTNNLQLKQFVSNPINQQPLESSRKSKKMQPPQGIEKHQSYQIKVLPADQSKNMEQNENDFAGGASKYSQALSNSFKIDPPMKASDVLIYTFKQIQAEQQQ